MSKQFPQLRRLRPPLVRQRYRRLTLRGIKIVWLHRTAGYVNDAHHHISRGYFPLYVSAYGRVSTPNQRPKIGVGHIVLFKVFSEFHER